MAYDARHRFDSAIAKMQAQLDAETCPIKQDAMYDAMTVLMDIRSEDLEAMEPKERYADIWQQRFDDDTADLY